MPAPNHLTPAPTRILPCPTCKKPVRWTASSPFRPFCSERCRLIDLGDWADERHRIPGDAAFDDVPSADDIEAE